MAQTPRSDEPLEQRRVATHDVAGYRADTDDSLKDLELGEAEINPTANSGKAKSAGGPAGMMPPMMGMGGMGRAGAGGGAPGATNTLGTGTPGSMGAGGATGSVPTTGGTGTGGAFGGLGSGDLTAGSGTIAAGSSGQDYGFGINPATGKPWSPSDPGFTERFGIFDPTTGKYVNPITGKTYDPATGTWTTPTGPGTGDTGEAGGISTGYGHYDPRTGKWVGPDGTSYDYNPGSGRYFDPATGKWRDVTTGRYYDNPTGPDLTPGRFPTPAPGVAEPPTITRPGNGVDAPTTPGAPQPQIGGTRSQGSTAGSARPGENIQVDTGDLNNTAKHWDDLSQRMEQVKVSIDALKDAVRFAKIVGPKSGYSTAQATASTYSQASSNKMGQASTNTKASAKDYADIEEANTTAASTTADDGNGFGGGR